MFCLRLSFKDLAITTPSFRSTYVGLPWSCSSPLAGITIDEFVESLMFMKSRAHPLDIVGIMRGMWLVYERMVNMHGMFEAVNAQLDECRDFLSPLLQKLGMLIQMDPDGCLGNFGNTMMRHVADVAGRLDTHLRLLEGSIA